MIDLKQIESKELLIELTKRGYLKEINVMPYASYELNLKPKYGAKAIDCKNIKSIFITEEYK